jgi:DNA-binding FadR family transcriptional regulator
MEFTPVQTRKTFEEAIDQIAERIKLGELRPGDRLPSERIVAAQMQISRPTLREAVKVLAQSGVLEVKPGPGGGMFVASDSLPRELLRSHSELRIGEIAGVLEARRLFEPRVAQLAAAYATEEDFEAMEETIERQRQLLDKSGEMAPKHEDRFLQLDLQFHLGIARATRNRTIIKLMRSLLRELEIARDMALHEPLKPSWTVEIHVRTLEAIRARDLELIEAVMDEHLAGLEQTWEQESGRSLVRPVPSFLQPVVERSRAVRGL